MRLFSHKKRSTWMGPYPLERLARTHSLPEYKRNCSPERVTFKNTDDPCSLTNAMSEYINLHNKLRDGQVMPDKAPIPDDTTARSNNIKGACYYLDASMVAISRIPETALLNSPIRPADTNEKAMVDAIKAFKDLGHDYAIAIVVEYIRDPFPGEPGYEWIQGTQAQRAAVRASETGAVIAGYLGKLGYSARAHTATMSELDHVAIVLAAGLGEVKTVNGVQRITNPYLGDRFRMAIVSTNMELAVDKPLARRDLYQRWRSHGPAWWLGMGGTKPGWKSLIGENRPFYMGRYPMERIKRVERTTTLIEEEKVPRVPRRHDMFMRAAFGDLGKGPQKEVETWRCVNKEPLASAVLPILEGMVSLQTGQEADVKAPGTDDPKTNSDAIKALLYYLGSDLVGIGPAKPYCWYSHDLDGNPIEPYHKNAIVILLDQGFETMEGASGDDWVSGVQSMRAYMRGALLGGIAASHIRNLGYSARTHSASDQDVLHIPLIMNAGLGELSRIGELVLNPYVGPRFKSLVITTDMPLEADKPIDFGLQDFCKKCNKCARECPCQAIPYGDKIMFNGYEIWKVDAFSCAKYRTTNPGGAMCGRCMKTCPYNIEGVLTERIFLWAAIHLPFTRKWIAKLDDKVGNGCINKVKKWWFDLEFVDGKVGKAKRVNARELNMFRKKNAENQDIAVFPIHLVPPPGEKEALLVDRKAGREARQNCETPAQARARLGLKN